MPSFPVAPFSRSDITLLDSFCSTLVSTPTPRQSRCQCGPKRKYHGSISHKVKRSLPAKCSQLSICACPTRPRRKRIQATPIVCRSASSCGQSSAQSSPTSFVFSYRKSSDGRSTPSSQNSFTASLPTNYPVPGQPRIQISSLLSDSPTTSYHLEVVQHPRKTAEFGSAILSRLPVTPPIIVQLTIKDRDGNDISLDTPVPFLIAHLSLFSGDGERPLDMATGPGSEHQPRRLLYGGLVSTVHTLQDLHGNFGLFFVFPDVSIRWRGTFQLGVSLMKLSRTEPPGLGSPGESGIVLAQARTRTFEVLPFQEYTAAPTTRLTQCFIRQGARLFPTMSSMFS